ncbi:MAG TPA: hypothetical protein VH143_32780 [Kofleriaceae bacterium]|nr:hypothetical protein [Kofleriaceae bacterium]
MNAESSVIELEALALGSPWAAMLASCKSLLAAELAVADAVVFPTGAPPVTADLIAQYTFFTGRFGAVGYAAECAALHGRAVIDNPGLAAMLRSPECLEDIETAAARLATPSHHLETHEDARRRAVKLAVEMYTRVIADQLVEVDGPTREAARVIAKQSHLEQRIAVAVARHEEHAKLEVARIEEEHRSAAELAR